MNWPLILASAWHGLSQAVLVAGTTLGVLQAWPSKVQWVSMGAGAAVAFVKGVDSYWREPRI